MNKQKFKIGEQVILQSKDHPELNGGPYTICNHFFGECFSKKRNYHTTAHLYKLEEIKTNGWWHTNALRKYYPPADESFHEMMERLKSYSKTQNGERNEQ